MLKLREPTDFCVCPKAAAIGKYNNKPLWVTSGVFKKRLLYRNIFNLMETLGSASLGIRSNSFVSCWSPESMDTSAWSAYH
jgi:hypothetical protein